jgi:proteic killer suppression protein
LVSGDKKGLYAVRVSGNWRIFFKFIDGDAYVVDYDDYY